MRGVAGAELEVLRMAHGESFFADDRPDLEVAMDALIARGLVVASAPYVADDGEIERRFMPTPIGRVVFAASSRA